MVQRNRITREALQDAFDQIPKELNGATQSFALASAIVRGFLGDEWLDRHVMPSSRKPGFLTIDETDATTLDLSAYRISDLAEVLYNLQHIPGFDECIMRMRRGDIEGTYAELDFGRMLYLHRISFRYIIPSGVKGSSYDVEVIYPGGLAVCGDAKCKVEATRFTPKTIDDTLEKARSQLPDDRPGIVFVKLPPKWMEMRRVVSVKYYASPITFIDGMLKVQHAFKEVSNPITDFGPPFQNWDIFHWIVMPPEWNGMPPWWQRTIFYPDGKPR
jgi:hypothetical protein